jgi:hypothetical protein
MSYHSFLGLWLKRTLELSISRAVMVHGTFLDFYSDYHPDLYGDMAITAKPKTMDPQK